MVSRPAALCLLRQGPRLCAARTQCGRPSVSDIGQQLCYRQGHDPHDKRLPAGPAAQVTYGDRHGRQIAHTYGSFWRAFRLSVKVISLIPNWPFCARDLGSGIGRLAPSRGREAFAHPGCAAGYRLAVVLTLAAAPRARSLAAARGVRPAHWCRLAPVITALADIRDSAGTACT